VLQYEKKNLMGLGQQIGFNIFEKKLTDLDLNKDRRWFLKFVAAPLFFLIKIKVFLPVKKVLC
jgi:hypothetical protein